MGAGAAWPPGGFGDALTSGRSRKGEAVPEDKPMNPEGDRPEKAAAKPGKGEKQEPEQAKEESSSTWDTEEHSDAPGPFGTG